MLPSLPPLGVGEHGRCALEPLPGARSPHFLPLAPIPTCGTFRLTLVDTPAFWAFLWFVGFCYLANQWQVSKPKDNPLNEGTDAARAAIAFSFFSIFTWVSTRPSSRARGRALPVPPGPPQVLPLSLLPTAEPAPRKVIAIAREDSHVVTVDSCFGAEHRRGSWAGDLLSSRTGPDP